ncbi:Hpt domain-containing response regulator [Roseivirga sp.]|uniref:Hpt domain-containing response regulator n=1 Tax=Roseivirga sp. TaxID=1964215 RepID=UPI003B8AE0E5
MKEKERHILVIDDNDINRLYAKAVLKDIGANILMADSGSKALKLIEKYTPDLILVDIQMPEMDGFECYTLFRKKLNASIPIIAITAYSDQSDRDEFISFGFNDCIMKPVRPEVLRNTINYWFDKESKFESEENPTGQNDFDFEVINELKRYANLTELTELYNDFIEETNEFNAKLVFLQTTQNYPEILIILHIIKGNAGSLGFAKLSEIISILEVDIKSGANESLSVRIQELVEYTSKVFNVFKTEATLNA